MKPLKIAIVGIGVAGSYLINQLTRRGHDVVGFERYTEQNFECVCAWGTSKYGISKFVKNCGLNFDDYIIHEGIKFRVEYGENKIISQVTGLVTFDKHRLIMDMQKGHDIIYNKWTKKLDENQYDIIIDATGNLRSLLPKMKQNDLQIPVVQYRVKFEKKPPYDDFLLRMFESNSGYFWYFPLENGEAHIGAGDYLGHHLEYIEEFMAKYKPTFIKKVGKPIRLRPPSMCEPFFYNNIVGVGESIGTVLPLAGEGIIPSLECAELFIDNMYDFQKYRRAVLNHFRIFDDAGKLLNSMFSNKFSFPEDFTRLMRIADHLNRNQKRYGVSLNPSLININPVASLGFLNMNLRLKI